MNIIWMTLGLFWIIRIVTNILSHIHLWYVKEYRWDRMRVHLRLIGWSIFFPAFKKPPLTIKTVGIFGLSVLVSFGLLIILPTPWFFRFIQVDILTFPLVSFLISLFQIGTYLYHESVIAKAKKKIKSFDKLRNEKPLKVIGITGSYGKTSTKEFVSTILQTKYKVLKTPQSKNSAIAVAETILRDLKPEHEIFVVEMAAYTKDEIKKITEITPPDIGLVTAINAQHQDLFGSIENTVAAKYELIEGMQKEGTAIFNADNKYTLNMAKRAQDEGRAVWVYQKEKENREFKTCVWSSEVKFEKDSISFVLHFQKNKVQVTAPVLGVHQIENILAAVSICLAQGMKFVDVVEAIKLIKPYARTMEPIVGVKGATFIDDTFNNNPDAAQAALNYLKLINTKGKKILVFQPMVELGAYAKSAHIEVGELASKICDQIYLTNDLYHEDIKAKADKEKFHTFVAEETAKKIISQLGKNDVVIFKGKEASKVLKLCKSTSP